MCINDTTSSALLLERLVDEFREAVEGAQNRLYSLDALSSGLAERVQQNKILSALADLDTMYETLMGSSQAALEQFYSSLVKARLTQVLGTVHRDVSLGVDYAAPFRILSFLTRTVQPAVGGLLEENQSWVYLRIARDLAQPLERCLLQAKYNAVSRLGRRWLTSFHADVRVEH